MSLIEPQTPPQPGPMLPATNPAHGLVRMGFDTLAGFEAMQRAAKLLTSSSLVPAMYRSVVTKGYGRNAKEEQNPNGLSNCVVALNMAARMNADVLMVMQNLHVIEGKPGWSSQWIIASINQCGRFSPLRFEFSAEGEEVPLTYTEVSWSNDVKSEHKVTIQYRKRSCRAWAIELATKERINGPWVSMDMAAAEGWIGKKGSKWQTMPEVMLTYRTASLFGRVYCPELLMGFQSKEEIEDIIDVEPISVTSTPRTDVPAQPSNIEALKQRHAEPAAAGPVSAPQADAPAAPVADAAPPPAAPAAPAPAPTAPPPPAVPVEGSKAAQSDDSFSYGSSLSEKQLASAKGHADRLNLNHDQSRHVLKGISHSDKATVKAFMDAVMSRDDSKIHNAFMSHPAWAQHRPAAAPVAAPAPQSMEPASDGLGGSLFDGAEGDVQ